MDQRKLALNLLEMQHKLDKFWSTLFDMGLDPSESILSEVDPLTVVIELYGLTSDDDEHACRTLWKDISHRKNAPREMVQVLEKRKVARSARTQSI